MEKARQAVKGFVSGSGKHRTTVDEDVRRAVADEHVRPHQHEEITTAVEKEIHQHHHHTTVQPITVQDALPEKHVNKALPVEHKSFDHANERDLAAALDRDAAQYKDSSVTHATTRSTSSAGIISGENIHHHVHEHIQPIIHRETAAPEIVHTTVPIHEVHNVAPVFHGTSTLPAKTLEEFTGGKGGTIEGRGTAKVSEFEGCPKPYNKELQTEQLEADKVLQTHSHGQASGVPNGNTVGNANANGPTGSPGARSQGLGSNKPMNKADVFAV